MATDFLRRWAGCALALSTTLFGHGAVHAQAADSIVMRDLAEIRDEGLERSQLMETLSWLSDVHGGRLTNSPSMFAAMDWAEGRLRSWGFDGVWREAWGPFGPGWTNEIVRVRAVEPLPFPVAAIVEPWTPGTKGVVRGPAVLLTGIGSDAELQAWRGKLHGAFVMLSAPPPIEPPAFEPMATRHSDSDLVEATWPYRRDPVARTPEEQAEFDAMIARLRAEWAAFSPERLRFFADEGAAAVVGVGKGTGGTVFLGSGRGTPGDPAPLPVLTLSTESYGRLVRMLEKDVPVTLEAEIRTRFNPEPDSGFNLLAEIRGRESPDEVVMFGAHFDGFHFATSVTDNGANAATMMEALRILRATGVPLRRTVRLALWTGEEQGLLGSKAYVHRHFVDTLTHARRPAADGLAAYYNLDNGAGAIRGAMAQWDIQPDMVVDSTFRAWTRLLSPELGLRIVSARGGGGTDHVSFYTNGLPGYQFMQDWIEYDTRTHHSNADSYERVVPEDVRRNAVIVASFIYLAANQAGRFPAPIVPGR